MPLSAVLGGGVVHQPLPTPGLANPWVQRSGLVHHPIAATHTVPAGLSFQPPPTASSSGAGCFPRPPSVVSGEGLAQQPHSAAGSAFASPSCSSPDLAALAQLVAEQLRAPLQAPAAPVTHAQQALSPALRLVPPRVVPSDAASVSEQEQTERLDLDHDPQHLSFRQSVGRLLGVCPSFACTAEPSEDQGLSAVELALGVRPQASPQACLSESSLVSRALLKAQEAVRGPGPCQGWSPGSVPYFPGALPCGRFLKPERSRTASRSHLAHDLLPKGPLAPSQEDLLLLPEKGRASSLSLLVNNKSLADWEELARRNLESASIIDSFLAGLVESIRDPSQEVFSLRDEICEETVSAFISAVAQGLRDLTSSSARLYTNVVLARRDALLSQSSIPGSSAQKASLRALPIKEGTLLEPFLLSSSNRLSCAGIWPSSPPAHRRASLARACRPLQGLPPPRPPTPNDGPQICTLHFQAPSKPASSHAMFLRGRACRPASGSSG